MLGTLAGVLLFHLKAAVVLVLVFGCCVCSVFSLLFGAG